MRQQFRVLAGKARRRGQRLQDVALFDEAGGPLVLGGSSSPVETFPFDIIGAVIGTPGPPSTNVTSNSGTITAMRYQLPIGSYAGLDLPVANYPGDFTDTAFIGIYSDDGTNLLARTADFGPDAVGVGDSTEQKVELLSVDFETPLVLAERTWVRIAVLSLTGDLSFVVVSTSNKGWINPQTTTDDVQTELTDLPASIAVTEPDATLGTDIAWVVRFR